MTELPDEFTSLAEAAEYSRTCRQAIYVAIHKGSLKAEKKIFGRARVQWVIKRADLDEYRLYKYNRTKRTVDGEKLFDLNELRVSVQMASKILSEFLTKKFGKDYYFPSQRLYYMLRRGDVRGFKRGGAWIIMKEELLRIYHLECGNSDQMELTQ